MVKKLKCWRRIGRRRSVWINLRTREIVEVRKTDIGWDVSLAREGRFIRYIAEDRKIKGIAIKRAKSYMRQHNIC